MATLNGLHLVLGVAMKTSICWPVAQAIKAAGGEVQLVSHPATSRFVEALAAEAGMPPPLYCDVLEPDQIGTLRYALAEKYPPIQGIVYGNAFSDREQLEGRYLDTSRDNFVKTMQISCFALTEILRALEHLLVDGASVVTYTFEAGHIYYPHYNVMIIAKAAIEASLIPLSVELAERGVRINAISASPERTPATRGIKSFDLVLKFAETMSPLGRRATLDEIAAATLHLLSRESSAVTGHIYPADCGLHVIKMPPPRNARLLADAMTAIADKVAGLPQSTDKQPET